MKEKACLRDDEVAKLGPLPASHFSARLVDEALQKAKNEPKAEKDKDDDKGVKRKLPSRDFSILSESDSSEELEMDEGRYCVQLDYVGKPKWPVRQEGKCPICCAFTCVWCYNCGEWVCTTHVCNCRIEKHHVIDRNRQFREANPLSRFTGDHVKRNWGHMDNLDDHMREEAPALLQKYTFHRQKVVQASWMLRKMLGDNRRKFTEEQEIEIAKTFEDIAKTMRTGSSSSTIFE